MPTFTDDIAAIRALKTRLATQFTTGSYGAAYAGYSGVDVVLLFDESDEPEEVGKPMISLSMESGDVSETTASVRSEYRDVAVNAVVIVSDFSGAQVGDANPVASDELLSIDLIKEVRNNYAAWRDLGLEGIKIRPQRMTPGGESGIRRTPHTITFTYANS